MTLLTLIYVALMTGRALALLSEPTLIPKLMGAGMLLFPLVAVWALWRELQFGFRSEKLVKQAIEQGLYELDLKLKPSGRATKESAALAFEKVKAEFDDSWQHWLLLAEAYDASGDRKRARAAMRTAISKSE
ncbi:MAG: hypothetical protein RIS08_964 [Actinomycetota bacterium]|jgi:hypothetical protein